MSHAPSGAEGSPWLAGLLANDHDVAAIVVARGTVTEANAAARRLFGEPVRGAAMARLVAEPCRPKLEAALAADPPRTCEVQLERADGAIVPARFAILPGPGGDRVLVSAGACDLYPEEASYKLLEMNHALTNAAREVSRRMRELDLSRAELERVSGLRDQFVAALSHELRGSLGALRLQASLMGRNPEHASGAEVRRAAERIERTVGRMLRAVDDLLTAARLHWGELAPRRERISIPELVRDVIDEVEALAEAHGVTLTLAAPTGDLNVEADRMMLGQVVSNLLGNALRHAPVRSEVRVELADLGGAVRCAVRDHGPGVPREQREVIFDRFSQGGNPGSAGLGLYIAREFVRLHRGRIWVDEAEGGGARFVVEIPRAPPGGSPGA